jgi:4-amino-4-deoxy-L-arabinose transferase-like glycosyltransferase
MQIPTAKTLQSEKKLSLLDSVVSRLPLIISVIAIGYIIEFLVLASLRMAFPYDLEWIEGAYVEEARWIFQGNFPFGPPSIYFLPTSKTPLYFYVSAGLMKVIGVSYIAPRLISILSTLGCILLLYLIVARETNRIIPGIVAGGIYAASFRFTGAWMDLAKTDSLFLFLILVAFFIGHRYQNRWGAIISGLVFVLAYFTKQVALPIVLVLAPISLVVSRGRSWLQWLTAGVIGLMAFWGLDKISSGWFSFYTFDTITHHVIVEDKLQFWKLLLPKMWPSILIILFYASLILSRTKFLQFKWPEKPWNYLGFGIALLSASWSVFLKVWTYDNDLMPASLGLALLAGIGYGQILIPELLETKTAFLRPSLQVGATILLFCQFFLLFYNPQDQLPSQKAITAAKAFTQRISELSGNVWVFNHGFIGYLAGKTTYFHSATLGDVIGFKNPNPNPDYDWRWEKVREVYRQSIDQQIFDWVIVDTASTSWLPNYIYVDKVFDDQKELTPLTGAPSYPQSLMVKNPIAHGGNLPLTDDSLNNLFNNGWTSPKDWGRWAIGDHAEVQVSLEDQHDYDGEVQLRSFCQDDQPIVQMITILWNGQPIEKRNLASCATVTWTFPIPAKSVQEEMNNLEFLFKKNTTLGSGQFGDQDSLSVGFTSLAFTQKR